MGYILERKDHGGIQTYTHSYMYECIHVYTSTQKTGSIYLAYAQYTIILKFAISQSATNKINN